MPCTDSAASEAASLILLLITSFSFSASVLKRFVTSEACSSMALFADATLVSTELSFA